MTHTATLRGADVYECEQCGRVVYVRSLDPLDRTVLRAGDVTAQHLGGKGGLMPSRVSAPDLPVRMSPQP